MNLEKNIASFVKERGINLSAMARQTGISYMALYDSLMNESKQRTLKGQELIEICRFLEINPMIFAERNKKGL